MGKIKFSSGIIKPDGVSRGFVKEIFDWMSVAGLSVVYQRILMLSEADVRVLYKYCFGTPHYPELEEFLMSGPVVFYVVSSNRATIEELNRLVGATDPNNALKETIRGRYGESIARNVIHSTQNENTLVKDLEHFLSKSEIVQMLFK